MAAVRQIQRSDGMMFKLGRRQPRARFPRLSLRNYLMRGLPAPPPSCDYSPLAVSSLRRIMCNDKYGCCVPAWIGHAIGVFTGNANGGNPVIMSDSEVLGAYSSISGFDPNDPSTDNGCDEAVALSWWQNHGVVAGGQVHKIDGYLAINGTDAEEVRIAIWLFGTVMFGVGLPDMWLNPMPLPPFTWDVAADANPDNGHCFGAMKYGSGTLGIDSWGELPGNITDAAVAKYTAPGSGGQLFAVISRDILNGATKKAPSGIDWTQLLADFDAVRG